MPDQRYLATSNKQVLRENITTTWQDGGMTATKRRSSLAIAMEDRNAQP